MKAKILVGSLLFLCGCSLFRSATPTENQSFTPTEEYERLLPQDDIKEIPKNRDDLNAYGVFNLGGVTGVKTSMRGYNGHRMDICSVHFAKLNEPCPVATISTARIAFQTRHGLTLKTRHDKFQQPGRKGNPHGKLLRVEVNEFAVEKPELKVRWSYYQTSSNSLYDVAMDIYSTKGMLEPAIPPRCRFSNSEPRIEKVELYMPGYTTTNITLGCYCPINKRQITPPFGILAATEVDYAKGQIYRDYHIRSHIN